MTSVTWPSGWRLRPLGRLREALGAAPRSHARPAPPRMPSGPVFIGDCATPVLGETLLLRAWRQNAPPDDDPEPPGRDRASET